LILYNDKRSRLAFNVLEDKPIQQIRSKLRIKMTITHLITHSGGFHADELLSSVILTKLFPNAELLRTRDRDWLTPSLNKIIYDVGGDYNADNQIYDHHQRPGPLRHDGQPYSSFGLIWAHYGKQYLQALDVPESDVELIHKAFDQEFILPIDQLDNGAMEPSVAGPLSILTLPSLFDMMKPVFDNSSSNATDDAFLQALSIARIFVEASITDRAAVLRAKSIVNDAIAKAGKSQILELPMGMPYLSALRASGADHLLFMIAPRGDDWTINGIKLNNDTFDQRADLPASWAGLTDADLETASGVEGAIFCHNARFIAVANSRDAIIKMADIAVKEHNG
jgi:uncharacterized UPF0160 family protein